MDTLLNLKAFVETAREGSFSAAARKLGVAPSMLTKRVDQLEWRIRAKLFTRTTRKVILTDAGKLFLPRIRFLVQELDDVMGGVANSASELAGRIRVKVPTTLGVTYLSRTLTAFQDKYPNISLNVMTMDRSVNPAEEEFDIAIGALPEVYAGVVDEPLCLYPRLACAAPAYLAKHGTPQHPTELVNHDCLIFGPSGASWSFESDGGVLVVEGKSNFTANNSHILLVAAREARGVAVLARAIVAPALEAGELIPILEDYPIPDLWLRALVPKTRINAPHVRALLDWLKAELSSSPPQALGEDASNGML
jgi:DNA-binding transcriptional LysR family regulator